MADAIGDISGSLKARYGDETELKLIEAKKNFLGRRVGAGISMNAQSITASAAGGLIDSLEERAIWARYGL